ncbi:hypothetical protein PPRY_a3282 [Pseudoalteromonas prydzensis ACAM 620]|nr:hypothetical protein [Pseudoalteromonas prydzensis ACAM 620]
MLSSGKIAGSSLHQQALISSTLHDRVVWHCEQAKIVI